MTLIYQNELIITIQEIKLINKKLGRSSIKRVIADKLIADNWDVALDEILQMPTQLALNDLLGRILHPDEMIKWRSVVALGALTAKLADQDLEAARIILRRLTWNLTEESGNCAFGTPETIGEILANHSQLASEFASILISYIHPMGNFLEHEPLQCGALWGIGRLSQVEPALTKGAIPLLTPLLGSPDSNVRGHAAWVLGYIGTTGVSEWLKPLLEDDGSVRLFRNGELEVVKVDEVAKETLALINSR